MSHYKPYPDYKDSGVEWIGKVPKDWGVKPIKIIASCNDDSLPESIPSDTPIHYVDISAVSHDEGISGAEPMVFGEAPSRARRKAKSGDVIVSTVRTYLKAVAAVDDNHADCIYSTGFAVIRARKEEVNPRFLKWLVLNDLFIQSVESHSEGLSYPAINAPELMNLKAAIPSLSEQVVIASILDRATSRIDALIAKKTRFIELLKEKRSALITDAVTGKFDVATGKPYLKYKDSGIPWLGEVPEHWEIAPLKRSFQIVGGATPKSEQEAYWDGEIVWVTPSDLSKLSSINISDSQRKITSEGLASCGTALVPSGSIVLSTRAPIGSLAIAETELCTNQGCKSLVPIADTQSRFFGYLLSTSTGELNIRGKGTTFLELSGDELGAFKVGVPPNAEQLAIAAFLDRATSRIDALIAKTQRSIDLLKERRSALITAAVTGQIDLRGEIA